MGDLDFNMRITSLIQLCGDFAAHRFQRGAAGKSGRHPDRYAAILNDYLAHDTHFHDRNNWDFRVFDLAEVLPNLPFWF